MPPTRSTCSGLTSSNDTTTSTVVPWVPRATIRELVSAVSTVKQYLSYVNGAPFQPAMATGLRLPDASFTAIADGLRGKRDLLSAGLSAAGFDTFRPDGTFYISDEYADGIYYFDATGKQIGAIQTVSAMLPPPWG